MSVGAVILDADRVVLIKRAQPPLQGVWSLPGGVVELGETLDEALAREVLEETGLSVNVGPVVDVLDRIERSADNRIEYHYVILDYLCRAHAGQLAPATDAADARWANVAEIEQYHVTEKTAAVIRSAVQLAAALETSTENTRARQ